MTDQPSELQRMLTSLYDQAKSDPRAESLRAFITRAGHEKPTNEATSDLAYNHGSKAAWQLLRVFNDLPGDATAENWLLGYEPVQGDRTPAERDLLVNWDRVRAECYRLCQIRNAIGDDHLQFGNDLIAAIRLAAETVRPALEMDRRDRWDPEARPPNR
jgi:hypothetical protein